MGFRRDLPLSLASRRSALDIDIWKRCLAAQDGVFDVVPLVDHTTGTSRKSVIEDHVIARGGGHLCPYLTPVCFERSR